jgi:transcriptional regulator
MFAQPTHGARPSLTAVYRPKAFSLDDTRALNAAETIGFGHLVIAAGGRIESTPMPYLLDFRASNVVLIAHLAKANPIASSIASGCDCLVIVPGADAYVSPNHYPSKAVDGRVVPTWNYTVIHLSGRITTFSDDDRLDDLVRRLTDRHEAQRARPWSVDDAPSDFIAAQRRAIIGLEMLVSSVEGKAKLSQNRKDEDRRGVHTAFAEGTASEQAVASDMETTW